MRASNLQEYVGKYAVAYARARDEELQELLKFKREHSCHVCQSALIDVTLQKGCASYQQCIICKRLVHLECGWETWDAQRVCDVCISIVENDTCSSCADELLVGDTTQCQHCDYLYCATCRESLIWMRRCENFECYLFK